MKSLKGHRRAAEAVIHQVIVEGLEGAVELESRSTPTLHGFEHEVAYRNWMGEQLRIHVQSVLGEPDQKYVRRSKRDLVTGGGRTWTHNGATPSGSIEERSGVADVEVEVAENAIGTAEVTYEVANLLPRAAVYSRTETVPLS